MYVTLFMIPFDYLFVNDPRPFVEVRILVLLILAPGLLLALRLHQLKVPPAIEDGTKSALLLLGPAVFHLQYFYYVFILNHDKAHVYLIGLLLIIFYGTYLTHRIRLE